MDEILHTINIIRDHFTNIGLLKYYHGQVMTSIIKCGMKLLIRYHGKNVDVQKWINNFIQQLTRHVITYASRD